MWTDASCAGVELDGLQGSVASPMHACESILYAALRVRADVPFACAGGLCGTCRAKLVTGMSRRSWIPGVRRRRCRRLAR
jgi:ferredoxin